MPYKNLRQQKYMHAKLPKLAKAWDEEYGSFKKKKKKNKHKK